MASEREMREMLDRLQKQLAESEARIAAAKAEGRAEGVKEATTAALHGVTVKVEGRQAIVTLDLDAPEKSYTNKAGKVKRLGAGIYRGTFGAAYTLAPGLDLYVSTVKK